MCLTTTWNLGRIEAISTKESFRRINLHWHDLLHEYASRLVEKAVPLAQVRDLLGHASITTTERYDNQKLENLQHAAAKLESVKMFDPTDTNRTEKGAMTGQTFKFLSRSGQVPN